MFRLGIGIKNKSCIQILYQSVLFRAKIHQPLQFSLVAEFVKEKLPVKDKVKEKSFNIGESRSSCVDYTDPNNKPGVKHDNFTKNYL